MFHVITACVLDQFMFVTNFAEKKSLQLHIGKGNYQQLKADKPCEPQGYPRLDFQTVGDSWNQINILHWDY